MSKVSGIEYLKQAHEELVEATPVTKASISEIAIAIHAQTLSNMSMTESVSGIMDMAEGLFKDMAKDIKNELPEDAVIVEMVVHLDNKDQHKYASFYEKVNDSLKRQQLGGVIGMSVEFDSIPLSIDEDRHMEVETAIMTINKEENFNYNLQFDYEGRGPIREEPQEKQD